MSSSHTMIRAVCLLALVATAFALPQNAQLRELHGGRIVNGTDVPSGKYPSQVSMHNFGSHSCGGSILNEYWVLTAAHCVDGSSPSYISILSGTVTLNKGGSSHQAVELIMHENYDGFTIENDVAVIKVETPFVWDANTQPVTLPSQGQETAGGSNATVVGWGYPYSNGGVMNHLQEVDYWVTSDRECQNAHSNEVFSTNICGYYPGGGKGQCSGDSGGPLFANGYQAGIVSWSVKPCAVAPYPGVFTEVAAYVDWINSKISTK